MLNAIENKNSSTNSPIYLERCVRIVSLVIIVFSIAFFAINALFNGRFITTYFMSDWHDTFMDYFNMLENVRIGDPYYAHANYPAIVFLILKVIFQIVPESELASYETVREEAFDLRANLTAMLPFILFCLVCLIVICASTRWMLRKYDRWTADVASYAIVLSGPMLFLLERGNFLLLSFACLMGFMALYRSEKPWVRVIACCLLALSASIKLYPAIFSLLLLADGRYKEFALTVVVGLILLITPFFVFSGVDSMLAMVQGFTLSGDFASSAGYGSNFSLNNLLYIWRSFFGWGASISSVMSSMLALLFSLCLFFVSHRRWIKVFACSLACIWVPSFSYTYTLIMLIPALLSFCEEVDSPTGFDAAIILALSSALMVVISPQMLPGERFSLYVWCFLVNSIILVISFLVLVNQFHCLKKIRKGKTK